MKHKKGFTLVELLAVVVILGIIATIIVPNVIEIMNKAEKDSFKNSAYGLWTAAKEYYQEKSEKGRYTGETITLPTDELDYEGEEIKKGSITISSDGQMEIYAGKKQWCAIKGMSDEEIEIANIEDYPDCGKEHGKPTIDKFDKTNETEGSITLIGVCSDKDYGISGYEYQIIQEGDEEAELNAKWVHTIREAYTFKKLKGSTRYKIKFRCQSKSGVYSDERETTVETKEANVKCYATDQAGKKLEGEALQKVNAEWQREKYVKVEYSSSSGSDRSYRIDQGKWISVLENPTVSVQKPSTVTGRASDGVNLSTASCSVGKVDGTSPEASIVVVSANPYAKQVGEGSNATFYGTIKVGGYCIDEESGIAKYEYAISEDQKAIKDITNWKSGTSSLEEFGDLKTKQTYYLYLRCTNNAGMKSTAMTQTRLPEVTYPTCDLDNYEWSNQAKKLTIGYVGPNEDATGMTKSYKLLKGEATKKSNGAKLVEGKEENVSGNTEELRFTSTGHTEATKVKSGAKLSITCNVTRLDMKKPKIDGVEIIPSGWYNDEKKLRIEKSDEGGSGLRAYYISRDGTKPAFSGCQTETSGKESDNGKWICDDKAEITIERGGTVVPSNGPTSYYLWVVDNAGNISDRREIVIDKIEKTKPTCTLEIVSGTKGTNGWYTSDVKVRIKTDDKLGSGEVSGPSGVSEIGIYQTQGSKPPKGYTSIGDTITIQKDGINHVYGYVKDRAGNENECEIKNIKVDQTAPTCVMTMKSGNKTYQSGEWRNTNIETATQVVDETSKLYRVEVKQKKPGETSFTDRLDKKYTDSPRSKSENYTVTEEGTHEIQSVITDMAGNTSNCVRNTIRIDKTKPTCTLSKNAPTGSNNWYKSSIIAKLASRADASNAADNTSSGVATFGMGITPTASNNSYNGSTSYIYSVDNSKAIIYGYVKDNAGNINTCDTGSLKIDVTKPICSIVLSGTKGQEGWFRGSSVAASFGTATDNLSGVAGKSINIPSYSSETTGTVTTGTIVDNAGNSSTCSATIKLDQTKPTCSVNKTKTGSTAGVSAKVSCGDPNGNARSGCRKSSYSYSELKKDKPVTVKDKAGNERTCTINVTSYKVWRYRNCSTCKRCSSAGCAKQRSYKCNCKTTYKTVEGHDYASMSRPAGYTLVKCESSAQAAALWYKCKFKKTTCKTCYECTQYKQSCPNCGCSKWGGWTGYNYSSCSSSRSRQCDSQTRYK